MKNNWRKVLSWLLKDFLIHYKGFTSLTSEQKEEEEDYDCSTYEENPGPTTTDISKVTCEECRSYYAKPKLFEAHNKEAKRRKARFYNYGWGQTDTGMVSKTNQGILGSEIDLDTFKVTHEWYGH